MDRANSTLTKYPAGSIRELWTLSWPMILSAASSNLLLFGDRVVLSHYSSAAFDSNIAVMPWVFAFVFILMSFTGITEVFVGQFNGAKQYSRIGPVVWQMIYFSGATLLIFIPIVLFASKYMIADRLAGLGVPYLNIIFLGFPISLAAWGALGSFFVGRGKTKIVLFVAILSNILNILLDIAFVFGWKFIPSYGCNGAAYATVLSHIFSLVIFSLIFLSKSNRINFHTSNYKFHFATLKKCLDIGFPHATSAFFNCFAWAIFLQVLAKYVLPDDFTAYGMVQSIVYILYFFVDGIGKGIGAVSANHMGARCFDNVTKSLKSSTIMFSFGIITSFIVMVVFPEFFLNLCFENVTPDVMKFAMPSMFWAWFLFCGEGSWMLIFSVLVSAGDTKFTMTFNLLMYMFVGLIPCSIWLYYFDATSLCFWVCFGAEMFCRTAIFYKRYFSKKWMNSSIFQEK